MRKVIYLVSILFIFISSCKKSEERQCIKSAGDESERIEMISAPFDSLFLYDNIIYNLIPDTVNKVVFTGGENLLNFADLEVESNKLKIKNNNRCNFLRSYQQKITATIHFEELNYIFFQGSEPLTALDSIKSNAFRMFIRDGAGSVNLMIDQGYTSIVIEHGYGDFTVKGKTVIAFLSCFSNSFCDATELYVSNNLIAHSNTQGEMRIRANSIPLEAKINQGGNIINYGTPSVIDLEKVGTGELIMKN